MTRASSHHPLQIVVPEVAVPGKAVIIVGPAVKAPIVPTIDLRANNVQNAIPANGVIDEAGRLHRRQT